MFVAPSSARVSWRQVVLDDRVGGTEVLVAVQDGPLRVAEDVIEDQSVGGFLAAQADAGPVHRVDGAVLDRYVERLADIRPPASSQELGRPVRGINVVPERPVPHAADVRGAVHHAALVEIEEGVVFESHVLRPRVVAAEPGLNTIRVGGVDLALPRPVVVVVTLDQPVAPEPRVVAVVEPPARRVHEQPFHLVVFHPPVISLHHEAVFAVIDLVIRDSVVRDRGVFAMGADALHHLVDVVVQHLAVTSVHFHRHDGLRRGDLEADHANVTRRQIESVHAGPPPRHRLERDRLSILAAGLDLDPLFVPARHDVNGVARLDQIGRVLDRLEGTLFRAGVRIGRAGRRLVHHVYGRSRLAPDQRDRRQRNQAERTPARDLHRSLSLK